MEWSNSSPTDTIVQPLASPLQIRHLPIKRTLDICFSLAVLILGLPLFAIIALAVKLTSKGRIVYAQERVGRGGKLFLCYKFRTMRSDADAILADVLASNPLFREEWETKRKLSRDPRITSIGRFLRKTSLDELPQFWNVLRGDLSIVGPRPVTPEEIDKYYGPKAYKILSIRPGITGLWQTADRRAITYAERMVLDEAYVDQQSVPLDILLILKTVPVVFRSRGAC